MTNGYNSVTRVLLLAAIAVIAGDMYFARTVTIVGFRGAMANDADEQLRYAQRDSSFAAPKGERKKGVSAEPNSLRVCPSGDTTNICDYRSIAQALVSARDGDTIVVGAGIYEEAGVLRANNVTIRAEPGAHLHGATAEGKAALVIKGHNVLIEGLECSGIWVEHGNGACVRAEGINLTLRRVYFHDGQQGILGGRGRILIEDSTFERLGGDETIALGKAHAIYIGRKAEVLILRRNRILSSKEEGHEVKSRAKRTLIEKNTIASLDGRDSRLIDIPNGGRIVIRNNILEKGLNSSNPDVIGIGLERGQNPANDHIENSILIEGNVFILDRRDPTSEVHVRDVPPAAITGNTFIGGTPYRDGTNRWFIDRRAAGMRPYPHLEHWVPPSAEAIKEEAGVIRRGRLTLVLNKKEASWDGSAVKLTPLEFNILLMISDRSGEMVSEKDIYAVMVAQDFVAEANHADRRSKITNAILGLRRKFRIVDANFAEIVVYPGRGFGWGE